MNCLVKKINMVHTKSSFKYQRLYLLSAISIWSPKTLNVLNLLLLGWWDLSLCSADVEWRQ